MGLLVDVNLDELSEGDREFAEAKAGGGEGAGAAEGGAGAGKDGAAAGAGGNGKDAAEGAGDDAATKKEGDGEVKVEKTAEELAKEKEEARDAEVKELKQMIRDADKKLDNLQRRYDRSQKLLKDANIITEDHEKDEAREQEAIQARDSYLEDVLEVMRVNPKFEDVDEVVSQEHFDDMIEFMARSVVQKHGGDFKEVQTGIRSEIWSLRNPYKFMYEQIKKYHPDYREAKGAAKPGASDGAATETGGKGKTAKEVVKESATSLQEVGGAGSVVDVTWTAARIDAMPEDEIHKVPADIWDAYMKGLLK